MSKTVLRVAGVLFGVVLFTAVLLGYSGDSRLEGVANVVLLLGFPLVVALVVTALFLRRGEGNRAS